MKTYDENIKWLKEMLTKYPYVLWVIGCPGSHNHGENLTHKFATAGVAADSTVWLYEEEKERDRNAASVSSVWDCKTWHPLINADTDPAPTEKIDYMKHVRDMCSGR